MVESGDQMLIPAPAWWEQDEESLDLINMAGARSVERRAAGARRRKRSVIIASSCGAAVQTDDTSNGSIIGGRTSSRRPRSRVLQSGGLGLHHQQDLSYYSAIGDTSFLASARSSFASFVGGVHGTTTHRDDDDDDDDDDDSRGVEGEDADVVAHAVVAAMGGSNNALGLHVLVPAGRGAALGTSGAASAEPSPRDGAIVDNQHQHQERQKPPPPQQQQQLHHHHLQSFKLSIDGNRRRFVDLDQDTGRPASSRSHLGQHWLNRLRPDGGGLGSSKLDRGVGRAGSGGGVLETMTADEFAVLPPAIQRKYFSTLERLRFAQSSAESSSSAASLPTLSSTTGDRPVDDETSGGSTAKDDVVEYSGSDSGTGAGSGNANSSSSLKRRRSRPSDRLSDRLSRTHFSRRARLATPDSLFFAQLPEKIQRRHLTSEEQLLASRQRKQRFILDPADEAVYKVPRRCSALLSPHRDDSDSHLAPSQSKSPSLSPSPTPSRPRTMETVAASSFAPAAPRDRVAIAPSEPVPDSIFNGFRWLEEDDELDLRLFLDDYHANLREDLPPPTKQRRPSFRRHMSISKIPFGRSSTSSSRPATKDVPSTPTTPGVPASGLAAPMRRRSRTLSLIAPKQSPAGSMAAIDAPAAHYQDPDARLKLRVYLASPQKFDEAIEFGFPSTDATASAGSQTAAITTTTAAAALKEKPSRRQSRQVSRDESDGLQTFLSDDKSSIYSDEDASVADPDSPKTPQTVDVKPAAPRPLRITTDNVGLPRQSGEYAQMPASSREMTLRMTLTRPDLRAGDDQIYGWQKSGQQQHHHQPQQGRRSQSSPLKDEMVSPAIYMGGEGVSKDSIERQLAALDHWDGVGDRGVMKRIWNRVRRQ